MAGYSPDLEASARDRNSSEQDPRVSNAQERRANPTAATTAARAAFSQSASADRDTGRQRNDGATYDMRNMRAALPSARRANEVTNSGDSKARKELSRKPLPSVPTETERTGDTVVHERQAPAVVHETIYERVHEHEQQLITREIHQHHFHHRVLPVHDVEVLPSVHYVSDERGLRQISADKLPVRNSQETQRLLEEAFKKSLPKDSSAPGPRGFSARNFEDHEGDNHETTTADGVKRSEEWWVHPPTLATAARDSGQTKPFHFDSTKK